MSFPTPNPDESLVSMEIVNAGAPPAQQTDAPFIGNFHKTLPHNEFGEVEPAAYRKFERTCLEIEAGSPINYENVPAGPVNHPDQSPFDADAHPELIKSAAKLTSPMAGASTETLV